MPFGRSWKSYSCCHTNTERHPTNDITNSNWQLSLGVLLSFGGYVVVVLSLILPVLPIVLLPFACHGAHCTPCGPCISDYPNPFPALFLGQMAWYLFSRKVIVGSTLERTVACCHGSI
eukprot:3669615-Amphidinium_carterae.1